MLNNLSFLMGLFAAIAALWPTNPNKRTWLDKPVSSHGNFSEADGKISVSIGESVWTWRLVVTMSALSLSAVFFFLAPSRNR